ncbi:MAG: hypothetical protein ACK4GT_18550 [Pararhodobacter sp.]
MRFPFLAVPARAAPALSAPALSAPALSTLALSALAIATLALAGCGTVAPEAPALLPQDEIVARTTGAADSRRGQQTADTLNSRAAGLRARADGLRRQGNVSAERDELLRRAQELGEQQS